MKRIYKSSLLMLSFVLCVSTVLVITNLKKHSQPSKHSNNIIIYFSGAVKYPGKISIDKNENFKSVLNKVGIKSNADFSKIDFSQKIVNNKKYYIPYKNGEKIHWKDIKQLETLLNWKIYKKQAKLILNLFKNSTELTWESIEKINGVGEKTINILKTKILIN
ncbi:MAG0490 family ComEA-like DNA-binding protein [Mycoplasma phocoenae]|uniref:Competence protein ComEA n=1 Tax=Mycoplasma phocoenae TaxID=754517 RepID=A0A858U3R3_9MOLU|nr:hypothetical protein [Mycoplasma phocoenae]QJG67110.1 hypothetical protein HGG69_02180 [Mycoplasma phocoenae]